MSAGLPRPSRRAVTLTYVALLVATALAIWLVYRLGGDLAAPPRRHDAPVFGGAAGNESTLDTFARVLVALVVIIAAARALGALFGRLRQPAVIGEVVAGLLLGPSALGHLWPAATQAIVPAQVVPVVSALAQMGVLLYMFLVGLELNPAMLRGRAPVTVLVSHASIVLPFVLGLALALYTYPRFSSSDVPFSVFALFAGVALSVTAFPVLARILSDRNLTRTPLGVIALACAAVDDVTAWCLLALVVSVAQHAISGTAIVLALAAAYVAVMLVVVRPLAQHWVARIERTGATRTAMTIILAGVMASALATSAIGIHAVFGAFLFGAILPHDSRIARQVTERLEDITVVLLLPAFFAFTGLRTQIGLLSTPEAWFAAVLVFGAACAGKLGGAYFSARVAGLSRPDSAVLGALMNTRGLMELIVLNVGLDLHVISPALFSMYVMMAVATTLLTTPLVALFSPRAVLLGSAPE